MPLPTGPGQLIIEPGVQFASNCYVHTPLASNAPINANSATYVAALQTQIANYYGVASVNVYQYTPGIFIVPDTQPYQQVIAARPWDSSFPSWGEGPLNEELSKVAIPQNYQGSAGSDQEGVIYKPSTGEMWELWVSPRCCTRVTNSNSVVMPTWQAAWGGCMGQGHDTLSTNMGYWSEHVYTDGNALTPGTTATGIPFLAGMMTIAELKAGVINHVLGLAIPETGNTYVFPAQRTDGSHAGGIPEGTMFRFPAALDLTTFGMTPFGLMIAKAVQTYGFVIWDTSGSVSFRAENPVNQFVVDPYLGAYGILNNSPVNYNQDNNPSSTYPDDGPGHMLAGFPWGSLVALDPPTQ